MFRKIFSACFGLAAVIALALALTMSDSVVGTTPNWRAAGPNEECKARCWAQYNRCAVGCSSLQGDAYRRCRQGCLNVFTACRERCG
jgi:hypothetical protein